MLMVSYLPFRVRERVVLLCTLHMHSPEQHRSATGVGSESPPGPHPRRELPNLHQGRVLKAQAPEQTGESAVQIPARSPGPGRA
jgi:hypothetical protein